MIHVVPVSGRKDSTTVALRLQEVEPRDYTYLFTPTGNELPETLAFLEQLECRLCRPILRITNRDLDFWIRHFHALPNWRQRWCTRLLKIEPCLAWIRSQTEPVTLYVGLRADEEERQGIYSNEVETDFPLRRWGMGLSEVWRYLKNQNVQPPRRNDCALCFGQRLHEWKDLLRDHPELYEQGVAYETEIGATFRSPGRDSMPADLVQLRTVINAGKMFKQDQQELFTEEQRSCRVCRL